MKKWMKVVLIVVGVLFVLLVVAAVGLKVYFTSDRLKALIIPKLEEATRRDIAVGKISLKLFPHLGIGIEDLTVSAPQKISFDRDRLLALDEIVLEVSLKPLLRKEVQVNRIRIDKPDLYLEINQRGGANFAMPQDAGEREAVAPAPAEGSAFALFLSNVQLLGGRIEYVDKTSDRRLLIEGLEHTMSATVADGGATFFTEGNTSVDGISFGSQNSFMISGLPLTSYQKLTFRSQEGILTLDAIRFAVKDIALDIQGNISNLNTQPNLDLAIQSSRADVEQLLSLLPPDLLKESQGLASTGEFQFNMTVKGTVGDGALPEVEGSFSVDDATLQYAGLPKAITAIAVSGSFKQPASGKRNRGAGRLDIDKMSAAFGTGTVSGKLSVSNFANPNLTAQFKGSMNLAEIKDYYPLEEGTDLRGALRADVALKGRAMKPETIQAQGRIDFREVSIRSPATQNPLDELNGGINFNNDLIEAQRIFCRIGRSDMALQLRLSNYLSLILPEKKTSAKPAARVTLTSNLLRTEDLLPPQKPEEKGGDKPASAPPILPGVDVDANVTIKKLVTGKFEFENAKGKVRIRDGVIDLQNLSLRAFGGALTTRGKLALIPEGNNTFDLNLDINSVQADALLSNFTSFGSHLFGSFSLKGDLSGALNDTLGLNPETLAGKGLVTISRGKLVGYPLTSALASYTGIPQFREVNFNNWTDTFTIANGRIQFGEMKIDAGNADFVVNGSQGLDGSLDYKMLVKLPPNLTDQLKVQGLAADLVGFLKDKDGRINLNFLVSGTSLNPRIALDQQQIEDAAKKALEAQAQEELKKLEEEAKDKLEDALKGIFKP
jgi:uncharacterized protein involved in outer membrane biogenesis